MHLSIRCIRKAARMLTLAKTYFESLITNRSVRR